MKDAATDAGPTTGLSAADHSTGARHGALLLLLLREYGAYECPSCREAEPVTRHLIEPSEAGCGSSSVTFR